MNIQQENVRLIFGIKLKQLRTDLALSQSDVAKSVGISVSYLNEIEKGKKYPKTDKILQLAEGLGVSYDWLVSLQVQPLLEPLAELLKSNVLTRLPLEIFGISPTDVLEMMLEAPLRVNAFVSTLLEMARNYDMTVENFYFSVLRSYQEMHSNYFPEIETAAEHFLVKNPLPESMDAKIEKLKQYLIDQYQYTIREDNFGDYPDLKRLRSALITDEKPVFCLNQHLSPSQKIFALAKEIGYQELALTDRPLTSSWFKVESFEQLLSYFKASYFAGALLIPQKQITKDIAKFIQEKNWNETAFLQIIEKYQASAETFLHRLTSILPKYFDVNQLFFLRFYHNTQTQEFELNKELHLAGLYNPHGSGLNEHYCRRWVSIHLLKDFAKLHSQNPAIQLLTKAQRSQYIDSENEYFCISVAQPISHASHVYSNVTIGFLMNNTFKSKVKFWNDKEVIIRQVGVSCERCTATDCTDRVAPARLVRKEQQSQRIQQALEELQKKVVK